MNEWAESTQGASRARPGAVEDGVWAAGRTSRSLTARSIGARYSGRVERSSFAPQACVAATSSHATSREISEGGHPSMRRTRTESAAGDTPGTVMLRAARAAVQGLPGGPTSVAEVQEELPEVPGWG